MDRWILLQQKYRLKTFKIFNPSKIQFNINLNYLFSSKIFLFFISNAP